MLTKLHVTLVASPNFYKMKRWQPRGRGLKISVWADKGFICQPTTDENVPAMKGGPQGQDGLMIRWGINSLVIMSLFFVLPLFEKKISRNFVKE